VCLVSVITFFLQGVNLAHRGFTFRPTFQERNLPRTGGFDVMLTAPCKEQTTGADWQLNALRRRRFFPRRCAALPTRTSRLDTGSTYGAARHGAYFIWYMIFIYCYWVSTWWHGVSVFVPICCVAYFLFLVLLSFGM
jgi:hypothetical protein